MAGWVGLGDLTVATRVLRQTLQGGTPWLRVQGSGPRVYGLGLKAQGLGPRVQGPGLVLLRENEFKIALN